MDSYSGIVDLKEELLAKGVKEEDIVEMTGTEEAIMRVSAAVKADRRRKNKQAKKSRKKNR